MSRYYIGQVAPVAACVELHLNHWNNFCLRGTFVSICLFLWIFLSYKFPGIVSFMQKNKVERVMETVSVCSSITDLYRHTICMQMTPHSALNRAVNGVFRAICHSAHLTSLSHSTALSGSRVSLAERCAVTLLSGLQVTVSSSITQSSSFTRTLHKLTSYSKSTGKKIRQWCKPVCRCDWNSEALNFSIVWSGWDKILQPASSRL